MTDRSAWHDCVRKEVAEGIYDKVPTMTIQPLSKEEREKILYWLDQGDLEPGWEKDVRCAMFTIDELEKERDIAESSRKTYLTWLTEIAQELGLRAEPYSHAGVLVAIDEDKSRQKKLAEALTAAMSSLATIESYANRGNRMRPHKANFLTFALKTREEITKVMPLAKAALREIGEGGEG